MKWQCGVTTCKERLTTELPRTLRSLHLAGFERPIVFVDGVTEETRLMCGCPVILRCGRLYTFAHWLLTLAELYLREPQADAYAVLQDDLLMLRNTKRYLEACWPKLSPDGYFNLFTAHRSEQVIAGEKHGTWHQSALHSGQYGVGPQQGKGALALVFSNDATADLLSSKSLWHRSRDKAESERHCNVDGAVVTAMNLANYREWVHCPTLCFHVGLVSVLRSQRSGETVMTPFPPAESWINEDFDAMEFLK